jgi:hypothetical protein
VAEAKHDLYGAQHAVIHFSGHGLLSDDKKSHYLWLGDQDNCVETTRWIEEIVAPVAAQCQAVTLLLDCCFAGRTARGAARDVEAEHKPGRTAKTIGVARERYLSDDDIAEHKSAIAIDNLAIAGACSRREIAYASMTSYIAGGWGTLDTCGLSLWTYHLVNHIARAHEPSSDPHSDQGKVQHLMAEVSYCTRAHLESEDTPQWRASPPRCLYPRPCWRIGRKHSHVMIDRRP